MAIRTVVTRGYGTFGTIPEVVTRGYTAGAPAPPTGPPTKYATDSITAGSGLSNVKAGGATSKVDLN